MFTAIIVVCSLKSMCIPSFVFVVPINIPSVVYGLRLLYKNKLEFAITSPSFVAPLLLVSEIAKYIHIIA